MIRFEYRPKQDDGSTESTWQSAGDVQPGTELVIDHLGEGLEYEVRAFEVLPDGALGPACAPSTTTASRGGLPADVDQEEVVAAPQSLRIERDGCLGWDNPVGDRTDPGTTYEVRTAPDADTTWAQAQPVHDGPIAGPPLSLCGVPRGDTRTLLVVAVSPTGDRSEPAVITINRGSFDEGKDVEVAASSQHPAFGGTLANCSVIAGVLTQSASGKFYGAAGAKFYAGLGGKFYGRKKAAATYQWSYTIGAAPPSEDGRLITVDVRSTAPGWFLQYRAHLSSAKFYAGLGGKFYGRAWEPFYGAGESSWRRWPGALPVRAADAYDFRLTMPGTGKASGEVSQLAVRVTRPSAPGAGSHTLLAAPTAVTLVPAGVTEVPGNFRLKVTLTSMLDVRFTARVSNGLANGGNLKLQYSTDDATWADLSAEVIALTVTGTFAAAWAAVPTGAKADVYVRAVTSGGNGTATPTLALVAIQVR